MQVFRCPHCNKLLGMIEGKAEIKCDRCKAKLTADFTRVVPVITSDRIKENEFYLKSN